MTEDNMIAIEYAFVDEWGHLYQHPQIRGIRISWRGAGAWVVADSGSVLNNKNEWEYEPFSSSRTDEFIQRTRFSFNEAKHRALKIINRVKGIENDRELSDDKQGSSP